MTARGNITIRRGATLPIIGWRLTNAGQPFDGSGSTFVLTIRCNGETRTWSTADQNPRLTYDNATGRLVWRRTLEESLFIGCGNTGRYEIERWIGQDQGPLVEGNVIGVGGLADE